MSNNLIIRMDYLKANIRHIIEKTNLNNIEIMGVVKGVNGDQKIVALMMACGIKYIADAQIENLKKLHPYTCKKVLLRLPCLSEIDDLVQYVDISFNSEIETLKKISNLLKDTNKIHQVVLMIDLGEYREGVLPDDVKWVVEEITHLSNIELIGVGTTLTCINGVIPDEMNINTLCDVADYIRENFNLNINIVSAGNSSSYYMLEKDLMNSKVNNLRLGELLLLGRETAFGNVIPDLHDDVFELQSEVVEVKVKPSYPKGTIGLDAFGNKPSLLDRGTRKRALLAIGSSGVSPEHLTPLDESIEIIGWSSDYLVVDVTSSNLDYKVGSPVSFRLKYGALMRAFSSNQIKKTYKYEVDYGK